MKKKKAEAAPDLSSVGAIRAAFEQRRPAFKEAVDDGFLEPPTPEEYEQIEAFGRFLRAAIATVLGTDTADAPRALSSWSAEQRTLLEEIAKVPEGLHINADFLSETLSRLGAIDIGATDDDRLLRRYAGLAERSVLESEVDGRPLWLSLRLCLMGKLERNTWFETVAELAARERIDLAKRATDNAYQLMRRWPLPRDITPETERDDATQLYELLLPVLEPISAEERAAAISREQRAEIPNPGLVLLLSLGQASHGEALTANVESLTSALSLFTNTTIGVRFLTSLPADRRRELIEAIELFAHNLHGWAYLELLEPGDKQRAVIRALASFERTAKPKVMAHVSLLIQTFDDAARGELRDLAQTGGPNAKVIEAALAKQR